MFGLFGQGARRKKAAAKLVRELLAGGDAQALLGALTADDRGPVLARAVDELLFDDAIEQASALAAAALALGVRDDDGLEGVERALSEAGDTERAIEVCELALERDPDNEPWLLRFASHLIAVDRVQEALDVIEDAGLDTDAAVLARAQALAALGRREDALALAARASEGYERQMKGTLDPSAWEYAKRGYTAAEEVRAALQAELHGAETVVLAAAQRATLDARAGVNFRLLAEAQMVKSTYRPAQPRLQSPEETLARAASMPQDEVAFALKGSAELRLGRLGHAREAFEAACAANAGHFAGLRGLGAVADFERYGLWRRVEQLPELELPAGSEQVIGDLAALTARERRVVAASLGPLASLLQPVADAGATMRLLPIDVRTIDLPEWRAARGSRFTDDYRAMDALGGVADPEAKLAVARIEELLDIATESSFTFAHELAHLFFFHAPEALRERVSALHERSLDIPHVAGEYQRSNEHEFFAVSYQDYLRARYDLPQYRVPDAEGLFAETVALFDSLG